MGGRKQIFALQGPLLGAGGASPPNPAASSCRMQCGIRTGQRQEQAARPGPGCVKARRGFLCCPLPRDLAAAPAPAPARHGSPGGAWLSQLGPPHPSSLESWIHRIIKVEKDLSDHHSNQQPAAPPCPTSPCPQVLHSHVFESFQGWRLHSYPGQFVPVLHNPFGEEISPI